MIPIMIEIDPTNVCNLRCVHCHNALGLTGPPTFLELDEIARIRDLVGEEPTKLVLTGTGDLLCHPRWREMLELLEGSPVHVALHTNGLLLGDGAAATPWDFDCVKLVHVSIDAAEEESYRAIRGGSWSRLLRNLERLSSHPRRKAMRLSMSVMQRNLEEVASFCGLAVETGMDGVVFQRLHALTYPLVEREGYTFDGDAEQAVDLERFRELLATGCEALAAAGCFVELWRLPAAHTEACARALGNKGREDRHFAAVFERRDRARQQIGPVACELPWLEINRFVDGNYRACCSQTHDTAYGGQGASIEQAWASEELARDRELIAAGLRPPACEAAFCDIARDVLRELPVENASPSTAFDGRVAAPEWVGIETTRYCNLRCRMCLQYLDGTTVKGPHMDLRTFERVADQLFPFVRTWQPSVSGEATTSSLLPAMLERATADGVRTELVTNATLLTEALIAKIAPHLYNVVFSVDGPRAEVFEAIREGADFERVLKRMRSLIAHCREHGQDTTFAINCTLMRRNTEALPDLVDLAADLGLDYIVATPVFPVGEEMKRESLAHHPELTRRCVDRALERARQRRIALIVLPVDGVIEATTDDAGDRAFGARDGHVEGLGRREFLPPGHVTPGKRESPLAPQVAQRRADALAASTFPPPHEAGPRPPERAAIGWCDYLWKKSYVSIEGDVRPCCVFGAPVVGNLHAERFEQIWNGPAYRDLRVRLAAGEPAPVCKGCMHAVQLTDPQAIDEALRGLEVPVAPPITELETQLAAGRWIGYRSSDDPAGPHCFEISSHDGVWSGRMARPAVRGRWEPLTFVTVEEHTLELGAIVDGEPLRVRGRIAGHGRAAQTEFRQGERSGSLELVRVPGETELPRPEVWEGRVDDGEEEREVRLTLDGIHTAHCTVALPHAGVRDLPVGRWWRTGEDLIVETLVGERFLRARTTDAAGRGLTGTLRPFFADRWQTHLEDGWSLLIVELDEERGAWRGTQMAPRFEWSFRPDLEVEVDGDAVRLLGSAGGEPFTFEGRVGTSMTIEGRLAVGERSRACTLTRSPPARVLGGPTFSGSLIWKHQTHDGRLRMATNVHGGRTCSLDLPVIGLRDGLMWETAKPEAEVDLAFESPWGLARLIASYQDQGRALTGVFQVEQETEEHPFDFVRLP